MLKEKLKRLNKKDWKINAIYALLIISNIALFIGFINYHTTVGIKIIDYKTFENIAAIIAAICILGYVSSKLPKIKDLSESSLFGIAYFIIICAIGLMSSYFNGSINTSMFFGSYLEMFKILCGVLIFVLLATHLKSFKEILDGKFTLKNQMVCLIVFAAVGLFASYAHVDINGTPANIRCLIVMISGLFGGPVVGIPVGIISGAYRYALGGITALPCAISTIICGVIASLIFVWNDKKFPGIIESLVLMFLFTGFEMLLVVLMTPADISFPFVQNIYPIMAFASVSGMLLFSIVIKEASSLMNPQPSENEQKISAFKDELNGHHEKIEELKNEIEHLKNEIKNLKNE